MCIVEFARFTLDVGFSAVRVFRRFRVVGCTLYRFYYHDLV